MSLQELERAVTGLSPGDLDAFSRWFEEYLADAWDRQIKADAAVAASMSLRGKPTTTLKLAVARRYEPLCDAWLLVSLSQLAQ